VLLLNIDLENKELINIFQLFFDELPHHYEIKNTSRGDSDFREAVIAEWSSGEKYVIKLSDNDFTFPEKIETWKRCAEEYRKLGYYCPVIFSSKQGDFPRVTYKGHNCVVYAEEFCNYPSGFCLFEKFCPSDETDEVLETAMAWKKYADSLPERFQAQIQRIWQRWIDNRNELEKIYYQLPTSVFQADLNSTNLLLDDNGEFVGVFDFNLCGRDVFLNYLFREIHWQYDEKYLLETLRKVSQVYCFSDLEKQAAPLLYRCLKPLWDIKALKDTGNDENAIQVELDNTEELQTKEIEFAAYMGVD